MPCMCKLSFQVGRHYREDSKPAPRQTVVNKGKVDTSHVASRLTECLAVIEEKKQEVQK